MIWPQAYSKAMCRDRCAVNDLAAEGVKRNGAGVHTFTNINDVAVKRLKRTHWSDLLKTQLMKTVQPFLRVMEQHVMTIVNFSGISPVPVLRNLTFPSNRNLKVKIAVDEIS